MLRAMQMSVLYLTRIRSLCIITDIQSVGIVLALLDGKYMYIFEIVNIDLFYITNMLKLFILFKQVYNCTLRNFAINKPPDTKTFLLLKTHVLVSRQP